MTFLLIYEFFYKNIRLLNNYSNIRIFVILKYKNYILYAKQNNKMNVKKKL